MGLFGLVIELLSELSDDKATEGGIDLVRGAWMAADIGLVGLEFLLPLCAQNRVIEDDFCLFDCLSKGVDSALSFRRYGPCVGVLNDVSMCASVTGAEDDVSAVV